MSLNFVQAQNGPDFLFWQAVTFEDQPVGHIARNNLIETEFYFCAYKEIDLGRTVYDMNFSGKFATLHDAQKQAKKFADWKFVAA